MRTALRFAALIATLISAPVMAWDGAPSGVIGQIHVAPGANYAFRVYLTGVSSYCGANTAQYDFAYLNEADSNYKTYVAALLMAKATGSRVTLYLQRDNSACKIGYIIVS